MFLIAKSVSLNDGRVGQLNSQALFATAETHVNDLLNNAPSSASCLPLSWSASSTIWKPCCVDNSTLRDSEVSAEFVVCLFVHKKRSASSVGRQALCVASKPRTLTQAWEKYQYTGRALEIVDVFQLSLSGAGASLAKLRPVRSLAFVCFASAASNFVLVHSR